LKHAVGAVFAWSLRRRVGGARFLGALAVALLPGLNIALNAAFGADDQEQFTIYLRYVVPMCLYFVTPFVTMMTMLPLLGELYDKGSIGYLYTRQAPRWVPLLGLYSGGVSVMLILFAAAAFVPAAIGALTTDAPSPISWLRVALGLFGALAFAAIAYGAVCLFLGVWTKRAILWAAGLLVFWGVAIGSVPGSLRATSLHHYLFGLVRKWCGVSDTWSGMFPPVSNPPGVLICILVLLGAAVAFFLLAARTAERRDVL
jgi:ABC-type transport system involved in multi-copper enzyme maturation permease subunit